MNEFLLEMVIPFIVCLYCYYIGYKSGKSIQQHKTLLRMYELLDERNVPDELVNDTDVDSTIVTFIKYKNFTVQKMVHEIDDGIHYFYFENDKSFVCQGSSLEEAAKNFTINKGQFQIGCFEENNTSLYFVNSKCVSPEILNDGSDLLNNV